MNKQQTRTSFDRATAVEVGVESIGEAGTCRGQRKHEEVVERGDRGRVTEQRALG